MKIIIIGSAHPLRGGGISTFNERLAELFQEENEVILYSFSLQYPGFLFPGKNQFTDEPAPKNLKIKSVINSINPLNWIKVGFELKKEKADLIIVRYWLPFMGPSFGTILRIAKNKKTTKIVSILDNVIPHEKRFGDKGFTQYFLKPIDGFLSMSHEVLQDLKKFDTKKPTVYSPHPLYDNYGEAITKQAARRQLNLSEDGQYILFFGFIRKYKGLDILLEAMADERVKNTNIKLIIAGEYYGDEEFYTHLIKKHQLQKQIYLFTQFIPNEEVKLYFCAADCVVQPYRTATQSGISQIAYHFEKPMIVTNVGGLPEIVPNDKVGFVTDVSSKSIADAILNFYKLKKEEQFIENIKEEKKKYSWSYFIDNIKTLYNTIT